MSQMRAYSRQNPTPPGTTIGLLLLCLCLLLPPPAIAQGGVSGGGAEANRSGPRYGTIWRIRGNVSAINPTTGRTRPLLQDDLVYVGERITAATRGEAVILTDDAGMIAVRGNTEFTAEGFEARGRNTDRMALRLLKGSLRVITGWVGLVHRDGYKLSTPTATIGIRGTDHETFVLTAEQAESLPHEAGSYDKVNRGGTVLSNAVGKVEIAPGRVGFARDIGDAGETNRSLLTLLLPTLLERIPDFYVGGSFDQELDQYSEKADTLIQQKLDEARRQAGISGAGCIGEPAALDWLARFDEAVKQRSVEGVLRLFAEDAKIQATVMDSKGATLTSNFSHEEFARSVSAAASSLEDYQQRRLSVETELLEPKAGQVCQPIKIRSEVVEQGKLGGRPYQLKSEEEHILELRGSQWLAVDSRTTQK